MFTYLCRTYQGFWDSFVDWGEVTNNKGHQVGAHIDTGLFKLIQYEATVKCCGLGLKQGEEDQIT